MLKTYDRNSFFLPSVTDFSDKAYAMPNICLNSSSSEAMSCAIPSPCPQDCRWWSPT